MTSITTRAGKGSPLTFGEVDANFLELEARAAFAKDALSLKEFGAVGDNVADDTAAVNSWLSAVIASGVAGYVPAGTYRVTQALNIDVFACRSTGLTIRGDGPRRSILNSTYTAGTCFSLITTGTTASQGFFYCSFEGIGFQGTVDGTVLALGGTLSAGNSCLFRNITVNNGSNGVNAKGAVITRFFASTFENFTVNGAAGGVAANSTALELNEVQFCNFTGGALGNCKTGLVFGTGASGYSYGNTFCNLDIEECVLCIKIVSAFATRNTFLGGTLISTFGDYCIDAVAGVFNSFANVVYGAYNIAPFNGVTGTVDIQGHIFSSPAGVLWETPFQVTTNYGTAFNIQSQFAEGSEAAPTAVTTRKAVYSHFGRPYNGTDYQTCARIDIFSDGTPATTTSSPGSIALYTTPSGSVTPVSRLQVSAAGHTVPSADNTYLLGQSGARWSAVWAATGTIQTSDERDKTDIQPLALGLEFIDALRPVSFRFKVGSQNVIGQAYYDDDGRLVGPDDPAFEQATPGEVLVEPVPGRRTHWGHLAQDVKAACDQFGVDFAGWILSDPGDPESQQGLRTDQLIAPLVKAVQELHEQLAAVTARLGQVEQQLRPEDQ